MLRLGEAGYQSEEEGCEEEEEEEEGAGVQRLPNGLKYRWVAVRWCDPAPGRRGGAMDTFLDLDKLFDPSNGGMIEMVQLPDIFLDHPTVSVTVGDSTNPQPPLFQESDNEMVISDVDTGEFIAKKIIYD